MSRKEYQLDNSMSRRKVLKVLSFGVSACVIGPISCSSGENEVISEHIPIPILPLRDIPVLEEGEETKVIVNTQLRILVKIFRSKMSGFQVIKALSLVCTHQQCALMVEDTDIHCPCHGAQFDYEGKVLRGPAKENLRYIELLIDEENQALSAFPFKSVSADWKLSVPLLTSS